MDEIEMCAKAIHDAEAAMEAALQRALPVGTVVFVPLMHGQKNLTPGVVAGHPGGHHAYVSVDIDTRKPDSRLGYRNIPYRSIQTA